MVFGLEGLMNGEGGKKNGHAPTPEILSIVNIPETV